MTGPELEKARRELKLTAAQLGRALELPGRDPGRNVRLWETGEIPEVPGPVRVAIRYMLADHRAKRLAARRAAQEARQLAKAAAPAPSRCDQVYATLAAPAAPLKTRRRG